MTRAYAYRKFSVEPSKYQSEDDRYVVRITRGGKPLEGVQPDRLTMIEEKVMEWRDADHIHRWFVKNVQDGKNDNREHMVQEDDLRKLLADCEKVIYNSQLVPEAEPKQPDTFEIRRRISASGQTSKVIKNVTVAHKLLPIRDEDWRLDGTREYGEQYLKAVEETRDWAERMLIDRENGVRYAIYYNSGW